MPARRLAPLLAALLAPACHWFEGQPLADRPLPAGASKGSLGSFAVSSPLLGVDRVEPIGCLSGAREMFLGGDLVDPASGVTVRLVFDPVVGPVARLFAAELPFERSLVLRRRACAVFEASIEPTGLRVNQFDDYRLSLDLDCTLPDGTSVKGSASTTRCH